MISPSHRLWKLNNHCAKKHIKTNEEGVTLVTTLMLGTILLTGVGSLLASQLMSRRSSAKESYQQMAEAAANNGLNRILGELNNPKPDKNRGFFFTLDNRENTNEINNGFHWERINTSEPPDFSEICLDTSIGLPTNKQSQPGGYWPTKETALENLNDPTLREDGISKIKTFYRLRGYSSPGTSGSTDNGEAKFIIEGIVRREGAPPNSFLARSRLERSLYIQSWVDINRSNDWAILAAHHFELGPIELESAGQIIWHVAEDNIKTIKSQCNKPTIVEQINGSSKYTANLDSRIWPVVNQKQPSAGIFKLNESRDSFPGEPSVIRVWRIDDDQYNPSGYCRWRVLCQRKSQSNSYSTPANIDSRLQWRRVNGQWQTTATIRLREKDICTGKTGDCHIYVDRINLSRSKLLIENGNRPVVIHLLGSGQNQSSNSPAETSSISLGNQAMLCGVNVNSTTCNQKPERLVIITDATKAPDQCATQDHRINLSGNSLPAAWILMRQGTVSLQGNTQLQGIIWSHSYCSNGHRLSLNALTNGTSSANLIKESSTLWEWSTKGFSGYGQKITRGIRGTGLDQFQRF